MAQFFHEFWSIIKDGGGRCSSNSPVTIEKFRVFSGFRDFMAQFYCEFDSWEEFVWNTHLQKQFLGNCTSQMSRDFYSELS